MAFPCIVHLDLKGAPWKVEYLCKVISLIKDNGAWGVLIEWEDTFPYTSELVDIGSLGRSNLEGMYSHSEVAMILQFIKECGLEPIQLIQTIGHMEFVLKHARFTHLRELDYSPVVLCPSRVGALALVKSIVTQVMEAQPGAKYLHIGADEAWHMNFCPECQQRTHASGLGSAALYLGHIQAIAGFLRERYPGVGVLMWDDMMRGIPADVLKAYDMGSLVQPVVWDYNAQEHLKLEASMWARYSQVFPAVWAASAFKGANGSCQMVCSAKRYASNQVAWREEIEALKGVVKFNGIIITGWSRFDHFATLCELLPAALPSLVTCLRMWRRPDGFTNESVIAEELPPRSWPGQAARGALLAALELRARTLALLDGDQVTTWLNPWQLARGLTSPLQAESIAAGAGRLLTEFGSVRGTLYRALLALTGERSAEEVLETWLAPAERRLAELAERARGRRAAAGGRADGGRHSAF